MKKELLFSITKKDFRFDFFSGKGAGGQHRNRHKNCVRIFHDDSGAMAVGQSHREKQSNIREAFNRLIKTPKFKIWHSMMVNKSLTGKSIDDIIEEKLQPDNLKIEVRSDRGWTDYGK